MKEDMAGGANDAGEGPDEGTQDQGPHSRGKWANNWEFLLSMTGMLICSTAFGHFPFLMFKNGGVAFLLPFCLFLLLFAFPLFFLETAVGQYTSEGAITSWRKICPMFAGLGVATQVCAFYSNTYLLVKSAWTLFYLVTSFSSPLPWSTCSNWWNTNSCLTSTDEFPSLNITPVDDYSYYEIETNRQKRSDEEYFLDRVLRTQTDGSLGSVNWDLALCLLLAWVLCYFCVWKGHRSIGKVVYVTATLPYLLLLILFFRAVSLPGAAYGLHYGFFPGFYRLADIDVWKDAAYVGLYTLSPCMGVLTTLGSYNKYKSNCYKSCIILCGLCLATLLLMSCILFSVVGFLAELHGTEFRDEVTGGIFMIFVSFPAALAAMPGSTFWALLFFLLVFLLDVDTMFMFTETLATAVIDAFPRQLRRPRGRETVVLVIAVVCFLLGLTMVTQGGIIPFLIVDNFGFTLATFAFIAASQTIVIGWIYGADRFYDNLEDMIGYRLFPFFKYCWMFACPIICGFFVLVYTSEPNPVIFYDYHIGNLERTFGGILLAVPLLCIPVFILVALRKDPQNMWSPSRDLRQAKPHKPLLTLCSYVVFRAQAPPTKVADHRHEKMMMEEAGGGGV